MAMRKIEIDDDVFTYLKKEAEAFVDTPNTVLRRILLGEGKALAPNADLPSGREFSSMPSFPDGTPATIQEILSVVRLVDGGRARPEATQKVASRYRIAPQTVIDKYTRQLGMTAGEFDFALAEPGRARLFEILSRRIPGYDDLIRKHLGI